jgi:ribonuclease T2
MNSALESAFGAPVVLFCENSDEVYELYYAFYLQGDVATGTWVPTSNVNSPTNCPSTVKYLPKSS